MYGLSDEDDGSPPVPSVPPPIGSKSEPVRTGPGPALRGVWLPSVVLLVARTAAEDRVLGDLWYWTVPGRDGKVRAKIRLDDAHWVWRTLPWSAERLGLSRGQLRRAQLTLVDKGYVAKARGRRGRTLWRALPDRIREEAHRRLQARGIIPSAGEAAMAPEWKSRLRGVYVPDWALYLAETAAEQRFLGQLRYWTTRSKKTGKLRAPVDPTDGQSWEAKSYADWAVEIMTTPDAVERAVRSLRARGLVRVKHVEPGRPARFRLNKAAIRKAMGT